MNTFPWPRFEMGSAPVSGASDRALAVGPEARATTQTPSNSDSSPANRRVPARTRKPTREARVLPKPSKKIEVVVGGGREVRRMRTEALMKMKGGLRTLGP